MKKQKLPRTGMGFDAHEFSAAGKLALGGIQIKGFPALRGHSDGDAVIHAVIDALLGGAGKGDIGELFPDTSPKYKGISSLKMLQKTMKVIEKEKLSPYFVDITIVAEKPRLSKLKGKIRVSLAKALGLTPSSVNVKAKTPEGTQLLSPMGAIAVWAVATLSPK